MFTFEAIAARIPPSKKSNILIQIRDLPGQEKVYEMQHMEEIPSYL
jgi:hypothetical protein